MLAEQQFFGELRLAGHGLVAVLRFWLPLITLLEGLELDLPVVFVRRLIVLSWLSFFRLVPFPFKWRVRLVVKIVVIRILLPLFIRILCIPTAVTVLSHDSGLDILISSSMIHPVIFLIKSVGRLALLWWIGSA